jgi:hypothetical protein
MNNAFDVEQNLENFDAQLNAAAIPFLTHQKDADGNEVLVRGEDGKLRAIQGVPFGVNSRRAPIFQPGFGSLDSFGVTNLMGGNTQSLQVLQQKYMDAVESGDTKLADSISRGLYALSRSNAQQAYQNPAINALQSIRPPGRR